MLPNPLHPAIVHFPVVLAFLLPFFVVGALWAIRRGARPRRAWTIPLAGSLALVASAWLSVETGEAQDERVERVVAEQPLSTHEELAEAFLAGSAIVTLVAAAGLIGGRIGQAARGVTVVGALVLVVGAALVGHSGGQLVYRHGAAAAYTSTSAVTLPIAATDAARSPTRVAGRRDDHDDHDER
jgi:uncharacterized membrane protein